jgi:hypothetical protein
VKSIKTLGIATAVALALMAVVGASAASAETAAFEAPGAGSSGTRTWSGARTGENHKLRLGEDWFSCSNTSFTGLMTGEEATEVTVSPELAGCNWNGVSTSWSVNGCKFRFHVGTGAEWHSTGTVDIVGCAEPMLSTLPLCLLEIGNQNGLGPVEYTTTTVEGKDAIKAAAKLTGITYTRKNNGNCSGLSGTYSDGTYTGEWIIKGLNSKSEQAPLRARGGTAPPPSTKFVAEEAPVTIAGTNLTTKALSFGANGSLYCISTTYSGSSSTVSTESLTVTPTYHSCTYSKEGSNVSVPDESISVGACNYVLYVTGSFQIAGPSCGTSPLTVTVSGCVLTVGPQSSGSGLSYTNEGSGKLRKVKMSSGGGTSMTYTATGASCPKPGTYSDGFFKGNGTFTATNSKGAAQGISVE